MTNPAEEIVRAVAARGVLSVTLKNDGFFCFALSKLEAFSLCEYAYEEGRLELNLWFAHSSGADGRFDGRFSLLLPADTHAEHFWEGLRQALDELTPTAKYPYETEMWDLLGRRQGDPDHE